MDCGVCLMNWDENAVVPRTLPCGHTFCEKCLQAVRKGAPTWKIACPSCRIEHVVKGDDGISKLIKNFAILQYAEEFKSIANTSNAAAV
mmetsp:Transcript_15156/g.19184  ORF Transcript_15156/g.19184 Transcript_15156/m.19184 type:complete len:89 (-) Transcript_15156:930-1196(-)